MIEVVDRRDAWVGLSSRPKTITSGPLVGMAEPSTRAKWRALRSARSSTLKKCLTGIHIVRDAIFRQLTGTRDRNFSLFVDLYGIDLLLSCPYHFSRNARPDYFALPHRRKTGWRRDGGSLQGRRREARPLRRPEVPAGKSGPEPAGAGALFSARPNPHPRLTIPTSAQSTKSTTDMVRRSLPWSTSMA